MRCAHVTVLVVVLIFQLVMAASQEKFKNVYTARARLEIALSNIDSDINNSIGQECSDRTSDC